tara:strand:- start:1277 stop:2347 length:1071 start_codon:yes stop_codon:yes gene_type:complete
MLVRFVDPKSGKEVKRKVPQGRDPVEYAKSQHELLGLGYSPVKQSGMKLKENVEKYYAELDRHVENFVSGKNTADSKIRPKRRKNVLAHIKLHILPELGEVPIDEIKAVHANRLQHKLKKDLKGQSIKPVIQTLSRMLRFFYHTGLISSVPFHAEDIERLPNQPINKAHVPSKADVEAVLNCFDELWMEVMVRLGAETGMRISEILALTWGDLGRHVIAITSSTVDKKINPTKSLTSNREIKLSAKLISQLAELKLGRNQTKKKDFLFTNENGLLFTSSDAIKVVLKPAISRANVKEFRWRGLRSFYINELMDQNIMLNHVQKLAGHELGSNVTEKHYRRVKQQDVLKDEYVISLG